MELVGKSGRVVSRAVGCLLGSVRVCSLVVVVCLSVPLYQFPVRFPMSGGRFQGIHGCLPRVRFRPILCVSVRSCSSRPVPLTACSSRCGGPFPVPCVSSGRRCGGGRLSACLYSVAACDVVRLVPFLLIVCSLRGAGRRGCRVSRLACLDVGADVMCGVSDLCLSSCRSMREWADEMRRMASDVRYQVPELLACRIVSPRSSTRGTGREAERTMMSGSGVR